MEKTDVLVIGGGPAGLAAAIEADKEGAKVLLVEREERLGGILKQCIHDGFGLVRFGEKLSGPEYAERFIDECRARGIACRTQAFVTGLRKKGAGFCVSVVDKSGVTDIGCSSLVLACGCRERTAKQVFIHGTRPAGIFTAGCAQHFVNLMGEMITKRCVILGSGDIGLIMARRLTLEGARVLGVYEVKAEPSGLSRNIRQCLDDFGIPLHLSCTVTRVFGQERLTGVEVVRVDEKGRPVPGSEERIACDALILSVGLIPENEIAEKLGILPDPATKGPECDTRFMTETEGVFSCGNALHVNDLVDYVSESGELAGKNAARHSLRAAKERGRENAAPTPDQGRQEPYGSGIRFQMNDGFQYLVPQRLAFEDRREKVTLYFRSRRTMRKAGLTVAVDGIEIYRKEYTGLKPPEMQRLELDFGKCEIKADSKITFVLEGGAG